jgi:hypothetical protein
MPVGGRAPIVLSRSATARSPGRVTSVDSSTSCPQECAQAGGISYRRPHGTSRTPRGRRRTPERGPRARRAGDLRFRHRPRVWARSGPAVVHTTWGRTLGNQGRGGGRRAVAVRNRRDVHVSTTGCGDPPTASQHVDLAPEQGRRPPSPASTPVMTRMRDVDRGFLEPHSGWGSSAGSGLAGHSGYRSVAGSRHDVHRSRRRTHKSWGGSGHEVPGGT